MTMVDCIRLAAKIARGVGEFFGVVSKSGL